MLYLMGAAQQNWDKGYQGSVLGMGTSMSHYGLCSVEVTGVIEVNAAGQLVSYKVSPDGQQQQQVDAEELLKAALSRVQRLKGCEGVKKLAEGEYLVGKYTRSKVGLCSNIAMPCSLTVMPRLLCCRSSVHE